MKNNQKTIKQMFYLSQIPNEEINEKGNGVSKKISAQLEFFNSIPLISCEYLCLSLSKSKLQKMFNLFSKNIYNSYLHKLTTADFLYIRAIIPNTIGFISLIKNIKEINPECKILYEIPTYPYDNEFSTLKKKFFLIIDKINRKKLYKYVDRIVTLSEDKNIFNAPTLNIKNGVDCNLIVPSKKKVFEPNSINLIAVAQFAFWHGYERIIEGLHLYNKTNVYLHLVGNGNELNKYKKLVKKYHLEEQVFFYGMLSGDRLSEVYNISDIGLCSFCSHKQNIFLSSELKSRENLCRALPIITSTKIDIVPDDFKYCLRVEENDSVIDIQKIVDFANSIYLKEKRTDVIKNIRNFAEKYCSIDYSMDSVQKYIIKNI